MILRSTVCCAGLICLILLAPAVRGDVAREVRQILADEALKEVEVGVQIVRLGRTPQETRVLFRHNNERPFIPASNMKLITSAAAINRLGDDFKFRTQLVLRDQDVIVLADGDPTIGDLALHRMLDWDFDLYNNWAEALKQRGIESVNNVIVDDSVFDEEFYHPGWSSGYAHARYAAQVAGMNLNVNCVEFTITADEPGKNVRYTTRPDTHYITVQNSCVMGENDAVVLTRTPGTNEIILRGETPNRTTNLWVSIHDPSLFAATVFSEALAREGVEVNGQVLRDRATRAGHAQLGADQAASWQVLAVHETPLSAVLPRFNKDSVNLYGEALNKRMGHQATGETGSWENGTAVVSEFLRSIGINDSQFNIADGSGLARANTISPAAIIRVLVHSYHQPSRQMYVESLAIGGGDGTLRNRFREMDVSGRVFAKSGYIGGVSCLSGYLQGKDGNWYAFSIMMNNVRAGTVANMRGIQDRIVDAIESN